MEEQAGKSFDPFSYRVKSVAPEQKSQSYHVVTVQFDPLKGPPPYLLADYERGIIRVFLPLSVADDRLQVVEEILGSDHDPERR
jgi:hypothetical protein